MPENTHVPNCTRETCPVCDSWLRELREAIVPLWTVVKLHEADDVDQASLQEYV